MLFFKKKSPAPEPKPPIPNIPKPTPQAKPQAYDKLNVARQEYKIDNDINKLISVYEDLFVNSKPPVKSPDEFELVKLYIKAGMTNKAWEYMNVLLARGTTPDYLIYNEQASILKKESKYLDAAHLYMLCYLSKTKDIGYFQEDKFTKDIKSCGTKLKWNDNDIKTATNMIQQRIDSKDYDLASLSADFKNVFKEQA